MSQTSEITGLGRTGRGNLESFFGEFQVPDVCLRLLTEDEAQFKQVISPLTRSLSVCLTRWREFTKAATPLTASDLDRMVTVLGRIEQLIRHNWAVMDRGPLFDSLSPLLIEILVHLMRDIAKDKERRKHPIHSVIQKQLSQCTAAFNLSANYPTFFQERLREGLIEPRQVPLQVVVDEFDRQFLHEFDLAFLHYLSSLQNGDPRHSAEQIRDFLGNAALIYWRQSVEHYRSKKLDDDLVTLVGEVLSRVFEAISACDGYEPIEMVPRLLRTLSLSPPKAGSAIRKGLKTTLQELTETYLDRWRRRAANNPVFREKFHDAMREIRPCLSGKVREPDQRFAFSKPLPAFLVPANSRVPTGPPIDGFVESEIIDLAQDLSGVQVLVNSDLVNNRGGSIRVEFPGGKLLPPNECWLLIPYSDKDGRDRVLTMGLVERWHQECNEYHQVRLGGSLKLVGEDTAAISCCAHLGNTDGFDFQSPH